MKIEHRIIMNDDDDDAFHNSLSFHDAAVVLIVYTYKVAIKRFLASI